MPIGVAQRSVGLQVTFTWCIDLDSPMIRMVIREGGRLNLFLPNTNNYEPPAPLNPDLYAIGDDTAVGVALRAHVRTELHGLSVDRSDVAIDTQSGFLDKRGVTHRLSGPWLRDSSLWVRGSETPAGGWRSMYLISLGRRDLKGQVLVHAPFVFYKPVEDLSLTRTP